MTRPLINYTNDNVSYKTYSNVVALPHKSDPNGWGIGGIIDASGEYIVDSGFHSYWISFGGGYDLSSSDLEKLEGKVIWFGIFTEHWGHFLLDNISRLWILNKEEFSSLKVVYVSKSGKEMSNNFSEFLYKLGVEKKNLIFLKRPTHLSEVVIPEYSKNDLNYNDQFLSIFNFVYKKKTPNQKLKKVYFSRTNFPDAKLKEYGEKQLENIFRRNGYHIFYPEDLSLDQQIEIWSTAEDIVCINGTIPLNICFCGYNNPNITVLNKTLLPHENLDDLSIIFNKRVDYVDIYIESYASKVKSIGKGPFIIGLTDSLEVFFNKKEIEFNKSELISPSILLKRFVFFHISSFRLKLIQFIKLFLYSWRKK